MGQFKTVDRGISQKGASIRDLRENLHISQERFASILGYSSRSVANWEKEGIMTLHVIRSIEEVKSIYDKACEIAPPEEASRWMNSPNDNLDGLTPFEAIRRGEIPEEVRLLILAEEGIPV
jgi:transcriptional regulator with XRE-family HTH domain